MTDPLGGRQPYCYPISPKFLRNRDPRCVDRMDSSEREYDLVCDNGLDDIGNGSADDQPDPQCGIPTGPFDNREASLHSTR
jgi:hypothetical protein